MSGTTGTRDTDAQVEEETLDAAMAAAIAHGNGADVSMLIPSILEERLTVAHEEIAREADDIKQRQKWLGNAGAALAALDREMAKGGDIASLGTFTNGDGQTSSVKAWIENNGIAIAGGSKAKWSQAEIRKTIENVRVARDMANNQLQMAANRLSDLAQKSNQTLEALTMLHKRSDKTVASIIEEIR
ncbi:hypothetical protein [Azospirillum sp. B4]|uniref:hypothetical protein n=1 Tax=Azospirillum sp. B4 TaxID=95605 RepID=UPI000346237E|nr:hypothetical protein [Azospirillum sp. B4]